MRVNFPTEIARAWDPKNPCDQDALRTSSYLIESGLIDKVRSVSRRMAHGVRAMIYEEDGLFAPAAKLMLAHLPGTMNRRPVTALATAAMIMAYDKYQTWEGLEASRVAGQLLDSPKLVGIIPSAQRMSAEQQLLDRLGPRHPRGRAAMATIVLGVVSDSNRKPKIRYEDKLHSLDVVRQIASEHGLSNYQERARQIGGVVELRHAMPPPNPQGSGLYFRR